MSRVDEALRRAGGTPRQPKSCGPCRRARSRNTPLRIDGRAGLSKSRAWSRPGLRSANSRRPRFVAPRTVGPHQLTRLAPAVDGKVVIDAETSPASVEE